MGMTVNAQLPLPTDLKEEYPLTEKLRQIKKERDQEIRDIFTGASDKFIVLVGPCSADNEDSVCEYVTRLARVSEKVSDRLMVIPRIYTNKPRTTGEGYKGMLHQPEPDKAPDLYAGILAIRKMHIRVMEESGLTGADEMLYPENRSYLDDILSYEAIYWGAFRRESAAPAHGQRHGYSHRNEEPHQRRLFGDVKFRHCGAEFPPLYLPGTGCEHRGQ